MSTTTDATQSNPVTLADHNDDCRELARLCNKMSVLVLDIDDESFEMAEVARKLSYKVWADAARLATPGA